MSFAKRITSVSLEEALKELPCQKERLDNIEEKYNGVVITSMWAGGRYNHAKYYKKQEKAWLKRRIESLERRINKLKAKNVRDI